MFDSIKEMRLQMAKCQPGMSLIFIPVGFIVLYIPEDAVHLQVPGSHACTLLHGADK